MATPVAPQVVAPTPPTPKGDPGQQPGASSAADPAPMGDSEIDPVSTMGSVEFSAGSAKVRLGRKTKLTRPRLSLAAQTDLMTMPTGSVLLRIKIDSTGKVISAEVARSSGNPIVDQPCKLAAYNWWFEPLKDKMGQPTKDVIMFAIRFI
jgi:TonB family protein